jgi:hypothetical protein
MYRLDTVLATSRTVDRVYCCLGLDRSLLLLLTLKRTNACMQHLVLDMHRYIRMESESGRVMHSKSWYRCDGD